MPLDIRDLHGPCRVLAGPGTGKTHALADLYEQAVRGGVADRSQILVLTFSNGAAGELASRIDERLRKGGASYYPWSTDSLPRGVTIADDRVLVRLVTAFATTAEEVDQFTAMVRG